MPNSAELRRTAPKRRVQVEQDLTYLAVRWTPCSTFAPVEVHTTENDDRLKINCRPSERALSCENLSQAKNTIEVELRGFEPLTL